MERKPLFKGERFNNLIVESFSHYKKYNTWNIAYYNCICDCGNKKEVAKRDLRSGNTTSCGCNKSKNTSNRNTERCFSRPKGEVGLRILYGVYKNSAKRRNLEFNISKEVFKELTSKKCFYCNKEPSIKSTQPCRKRNYNKDSLKHSTYIFNGIDRIDNKKHYTLNNIVTCCKNCNYAKNELTEDQFYEMIIRIYENRKLNEYKKENS